MSSVAVRKAWYDSTNSLYEDDSPPNTGENTRQTKLYNFDPRMAHPKYGEDLAAMRATDEEVLGSGLKPTAQPRHNIEWEEGVSELLGSNPRYPDEEMHEVTHHGVKYLMRPDGKVQFPIKEGDKGIWLTRPTESDASPGGLFTHRDADKLVFVRGKSKSLRGMGRAYERNSDEAREKVAEMFLQRKKPIDPDRLVEVPLPKNKQMWQVLRDLGLTGGTDNHGRSKWGNKVPIKKFFPLRGDGLNMGEPMNIAYQLLKDRKSPEAWAHKLEYDKQYQKNPKRVKYREQLNAERRKRGIYGKGGGDVSHTQGGKLTLESPHANRARHFKGKGTLRRVKVK